MLCGPEPDVVRRNPCLHFGRVSKPLISRVSHAHDVPNRKDAVSPLHLPVTAIVIFSPCRDSHANPLQPNDRARRQTDLQERINTDGAMGRKHEGIAARHHRTRPICARLLFRAVLPCFVRLWWGIVHLARSILSRRRRPKSVGARWPTHTREDKVGVYTAAQ